MAHRGVSVAMRVHPSLQVEKFVEAEKKDHAPIAVSGQAARLRFATRAQAQLLDILGWRIAASPRREVEHHASLQCCFVLREGGKEVAAFGYTGMTAPSDMEDPSLRMAQSRVERTLSLLGEDRGVLIQNEPLFAFGGQRKDRIAVFAGWRFQGGSWKPFLFGPDGLARVAAQDTLFAGDTVPHHMAEVCGHATKTVMPWIANLARTIQSFGQYEASADEAPVPGLDFEGVRIVSHASGWLSAREDQSPKTTPVRQVFCNAPFRQPGTAGQNATEITTDEATPAQHDILFRTRRARFLLARGDDAPVTLTSFEERRIDKQLGEIEAIANDCRILGSQPQSRPAFAARRKGAGTGRFGFVKTILPNFVNPDSAETHETPDTADLPDGHRPEPMVVMKDDQFIFNHRF